MSATIRQARAADVPSVEALLRDADLALDGVPDLIDDFIVAESDGAIVGAAGLECCLENGLLRSVVVRPDWRSKGLGRELVTRIIHEAERRGIPALYLLTTSAEHYYPPFGFHTIPRADAPADIQTTAEFSGACPASAAFMMRESAHA